MKTCTKCKIEKEFTEFSKDKKSKDNLKWSCRKCLNNEKKQWQINNKEKIKEYSKEYYEENKEKLKNYSEEWRINNIEKLKEHSKEYYEKNKDKINDYSKKYKEQNKEKMIDYRKEYWLNNKNKIYEWKNNNKEKLKKYREKYKEKTKMWFKNNKEKINEKIKQKREIDSFYRIKCNIRNLIKESIRKKYKKNTKTELILGCSFENFKLHLESKFKSWMNWDNYGNPKDGIFELNKTWDIDHIIPLASAKTEEELLKLNHYTNLQPLCSKINRCIKKDKLDFF